MASFNSLSDKQKELELALALRNALNGAPTPPLETNLDTQGVKHWDFDPRYKFALPQVLQDSAARLLQSCTEISAIRRFCSDAKARSSVVAAGVALGFRAILVDVEDLLWATRGLTGLSLILELNSNLEPVARTTRVLAELANYIIGRDLSSAAILDLLHAQHKMLGGRVQEQDLLAKFLLTATSPYLRMMQRWVCEGVLTDVHADFFVARREGTGPLAGTDQSSQDSDGPTIPAVDQPSVRDSPTPSVLATPAGAVHESDGASRPGEETFSALWGADFTTTGQLPRMVAEVEREALEAGAYVLGLRRCGEEFKVDSKPWQLPDFEEQVRATHEAAGQQFLQVALKRFDLLGRLAAVRQLLLVYQADFLLLFIEAANADLSLPVTAVEPARIEAHFQAALRGSNSVSTPYIDSAGCQVDATARDAAAAGAAGTEGGGPSSSATGWDVFQPTYTAPWPVSILLQAPSMEQYGTVFEVFLLWKRAESATDAGASQLRALSGKLSRDLVLAFYWVRSRLDQCLNILQTFFMNSVFEKWEKMAAVIQKSKTFREVVSAHDRFLHSCAAMGFKRERRLHTVSKSLLRIASGFSTAVDVASRSAAAADVSAAGEGGERPAPNGLVIQPLTANSLTEIELEERLGRLTALLLADVETLRSFAKHWRKVDGAFQYLGSQLESLWMTLNRRQ